MTTEKDNMRQSVNTRTTAVVDPRKAIQTRLTEALLCSQEGVSDASVWFEKGDLVAHVTVHDEANWTPQGLQRICMDELGLHQTPRRLFLIAAQPTDQFQRFAA